jgi:molybdate transport system ATP-binding protein
MDRLVVFDHATVAHAGGAAVLRDLTWAIGAGETWAVVGPVGAGKTTLAETILGRHPLAAGTMARPAGAAQLVAFKEESWRFSYRRHYYQQRFNFIEPQDDLTLDAFLRSGTDASNTAILAAADRLGVGHLLPLSLIKLSNGQTRRARIARALLAHPDLLILDDPFLGLDAAGRHDVADIVGELVRHGTRVLLITRPDAIPDWVTHVLELDRGAVHWQGPRPTYRPEREGDPHPLTTHHSPLTTHHSQPLVVELHYVSVTYADRPILRDVSWAVRAGERWAVVGPNGSGKSTLLSLLCGDHPQAYSNDVRLFGRRRGTGESIWDVKRRVGLVSPELHLYYSEPLTASQAAATGFHDVLAYRPVTPAQAAAVRELFDHFGILSLADRLFARLSTGEQRLVLLVRALVKAPPLLILDEPFQGLDDLTIERARDWLDGRLRPDQTLLFVSHHEGEIPRTVCHRLRLEAGRAIGE